MKRDEIWVVGLDPAEGHEQRVAPGLDYLSRGF
jgi:hypothetical protein